MSDQSKPWDKRDDETMYWYRIFERYRLQTSGKRSLLSIYNENRASANPPKSPAASIPGSWKQAKTKYDWDARVRAFDQSLIKSDREAFEADRKAARQARQKSIQVMSRILTQAMAIHGKLTTIAATEAGNTDSLKSLADLPVDITEIERLVRAVATLNKEMRLEFGEPTEHVQNDVIELPSEVIGLLAERGTDLAEFQSYLMRRLREKAQEAIANEIDNNEVNA